MVKDDSAAAWRPESWESLLQFLSEQEKHQSSEPDHHPPNLDMVEFQDFMYQNKDIFLLFFIQWDQKGKYFR